MNRLQEQLLREQLRQIKKSAAEATQRQSPLPDKQEHWLAYLAHLSQVGLLVLAVLGYIYTIKPVYDKALLDKQIKEQNLVLDQLKRDADALRVEISVSSQRAEAANRKIEIARAREISAHNKWAYRPIKGTEAIKPS